LRWAWPLVTPFAVSIVIDKMDSNAETFNVPGSLKVTVELIK
jgi:hypothetical protein